MTDPIRALTQEEIKNHIKSDYERRVARWHDNHIVRRVDIERNMASGFTEEQARRLILTHRLKHDPAGRMFWKAIDTIRDKRGNEVEAILPDGRIKPLPSITWNNEPRAVDGGDIFDVRIALWREIDTHLQNDWQDAVNDKGCKA